MPPTSQVQSTEWRVRASIPNVEGLKIIIQLPDKSQENATVIRNVRFGNYTLAFENPKTTFQDVTGWKPSAAFRPVASDDYATLKSMYGEEAFNAACALAKTSPLSVGEILQRSLLRKAQVATPAAVAAPASVAAPVNPLLPKPTS